ncbi:hypothetical protein [Nocardioides dilutus]
MIRRIGLKGLAGTIAGAVALGPALALGLTSAAGAAASAMAPAPPIKVTQTVSDTAPFGNSVTCNGGGIPTENHFYRRFDLAGAHGASQGFVVSQVTLAVEASEGGTKPGSVKISAIDAADAFTLANLEPISNTAVNLASVADGTILPVPVNATVPAGKQMVLEVQVDGGTPGFWFPGSNNLGETAPTYLRADDCGATQPTAVSTLGFPNMHLVLFANGKAVECLNAETAVTSATAAVTQATAVVAKAKKKLKKAKKQLRKAIKSGDDTAIAKAKKKVKKAKKKLRAAKKALAAAKAALAAATQSAAVECAQPALPAAARPSPATPGVTGAAKQGFSFSTVG